MIIGKSFIEGASYDVISLDDLRKNLPVYCNITDKVAVLYNNYVLPIRNPSIYSTEPGYYLSYGFSKIILPNSYVPGMVVDDMIDFRNVKEFKDLVEARIKIDNINREYLSSTDNITRPSISEYDEPLMIALKRFIIAKNIDINKYSQKLEQPSNDKRKLNGNKISIGKFSNFIEALDGVAKIVIEDAHNNPPNPSGVTIEVPINPSAIREWSEQ